MKVIFLKDVAKTGRKYDTKEVSDGFALNYLIPQGLAVPASDKNQKAVAGKRADEQEKGKALEAELLSKMADIEALSLTMSGKANDKGHLFAAIKKEDIVDAVKKEASIDLSHHLVMDESIKEIGERKVKVKVGDKETEFSVTVESK